MKTELEYITKAERIFCYYLHYGRWVLFKCIQPNTTLNPLTLYGVSVYC